MFGIIDVNLLPVSLTDAASQAVVPVVIGPLYTFLAMLPAIMVGLGVMLLALFKPQTWVKAGRFLWHQKLFTLGTLAVISGLVYARANNWWLPAGPVAELTTGREWSAFRGGPERTGRADALPEPTTSDPLWTRKYPLPGTFKSVECGTFYSSPTVVGNRIYIAAGEKGPLVDRGGILCLDANTGNVDWMYSPTNFRATFSSPSVAYKRNADGTPNTSDGYVVCGEGLHFTNDARVTCLNLKGELLWEYRTASHVESSPCVADGRVYIGAGGDGYYCFDLEPNSDGSAKVLWRAVGENYQDCESSPIVDDGVCYAGLGDGGNALVAFEAATGKELWRLATPYAVFTSPTIGYRMALVDGKPVREKLLFIGMGNGNFVETAEGARETKMKKLREQGLSEEQIQAAVADLGPAGEVWCIKLPAAADEKPTVDWKLKLARTVLGGVAFVPPSADVEPTADAPAEGRLYFGSRDRKFYCISTAGKNLAEPFDAREPMITSPAIGNDYAYFVTEGGTLFCVRLADTMTEVWRSRLGAGVMSSPALGNSHIYVGTTGQGLWCLGQPVPPPPQWTRGALGGMADFTPAPKTSTLLGRYPLDRSEDFAVTGPLMPFGQIVAQPKASESDNTVYRLDRSLLVPAALENGTRFELVKFVHGKVGIVNAEATAEDQGPVAGRLAFDQPIRLAPVGCGSSVLLVEGEGPGPRALHCVNPDTMSKVWRVDLSAGGSGQFLLEPNNKNVLIWSGPSTLSRVDVADGKVQWSTDCPGGPGVGQPASYAGLALAATENACTIIDELTGQVLLSFAPGAKATQGPVWSEGGLLLSTEAGVELRNLCDGAAKWSSPVGKVAQPLVIDGPRAAVVTEAGQMHLLDIRDGQPWRLKDQWLLDDGGRRPSPVIRGKDNWLVRPRGQQPSVLAPATQPDQSRLVRQVRRVAAVDKVNPAVPPVLLRDRIIFATEPNSAGGSDLMAVAIEEPFDPSAESPVDALHRADPKAPPMAVVEQTEQVTSRPSRWCQTSFLGKMLTPVVIVEGYTYVAFDNFKLACLKPTK